MSTEKAKIWVEGRPIRGTVRREDGGDSQLELAAAVSDAEIDDAIIDMGLSAFQPMNQMQERLRAVLWSQREVFKGLRCIKGVKHEIKFVPDARPVCFPVRGWIGRP